MTTPSATANTHTATCCRCTRPVPAGAGTIVGYDIDNERWDIVHNGPCPDDTPVDESGSTVNRYDAACCRCTRPVPAGAGTVIGYDPAAARWRVAHIGTCPPAPTVAFTAPAKVSPTTGLVTLFTAGAALRAGVYLGDFADGISFLPVPFLLWAAFAAWVVWDGFEDWIPGEAGRAGGLRSSWGHLAIGVVALAYLEVALLLAVPWAIRRWNLISRAADVVTAARRFPWGLWALRARQIAARARGRSITPDTPETAA